ncbi:MAG: PucR family transcriptional regulator [Bacillota bacterium]|jgi:sugar diacid utilization regulator
MTVGDLLSAVGPDASVLAGAGGLGRCVRSASAWRAQEAHRHNMIVVGLEQVTRELVREADRRGAAAVAVAVAVSAGNVDAHLPGQESIAGQSTSADALEDALADADALALPVIALPPGFDECRLAVLALSGNLHRHELLVRGVVRLYGMSLQGFDSVDFDAVAELLSKHLHRSAALVSWGDEILGHAAYVQEDSKEFAQVLHALPMSTHVRDESLPARFGYEVYRELHTEIRRVPVAGERDLVRYVPVAVQGYTTGAVAIWPGDPALSSVEAVGLWIAISMGSLEMLKDRAEKEIERRAAYQFVEDLLAGVSDTKASLLRRADSLGWDLDGAFSLLVIETETEAGTPGTQIVKEWFVQEADRIATAVRRAARDSGLYVIVAVKSEEVVILLKHAAGSVRAAKEVSLRYGRAIAEALNARQSGIRTRVGIGQCREDVTRLSASYQEAKKALSIGRAIGDRTPVIHFDDLGVYRVISKCADRSELEAFVREKLGSLIDYDLRRGTCLVETLRVYFENASSATEAARALFVHVNTVKQRLIRISQISGLNLSSTDDQFLAYMALKILDFLQV